MFNKYKINLVFKLKNMKTIRQKDYSGSFTADNTIMKSSTSILVNDSLAINKIEYSIDFIPRVHLLSGALFEDLTIDTLLITIDNRILTIDTTETNTGSDKIYDIIVVREFDDKTFTPGGTIFNSNGLYTLIFDSVDFLLNNSKYSITIKDNNIVVYQGKMIFTNKDIQDFRYTRINNNKMYL